MNQRTNDTITLERLRTLISYDPESGELRWIVKRSNACPAGTLAGTIEAQGYRVIKIDNITYKAHRLAWLMTSGRWPTETIDHINGDRKDNRLSNLRECSGAENCRNRGANKNNKSGIKGVYWRESHQKWSAQIRVNYKLLSLGYYDTAPDAEAAYIAAAEKHFGAFAGHRSQDSTKQPDAE